MEQAKEVREQFKDGLKDAKNNLTLGSRTVSKLEGEVTSMASDIASNVKDMSADLVKDSVSFVKRYPLHTALGALAVGYFAGMITRSAKK